MARDVKRRPVTRRMLLVLSAIAAATLFAVMAAVSVLNREYETRLGGITIVERASAARPERTEVEATEAAFAKLRELEPALAGLSVAASRHSGQLLRAEDSEGRHIISQTNPINAWVLEFTGPTQGMYADITALVVVDAITGEVEAAQILQSNPEP
jgi:hypothetical protein